MRTKFNWKLFVLLVVGVLALAVGWRFLHRYQVRRMNPSFLVQARAAEEKGQADRAQRFYKQYLLMQADDVEARARYAELMEKHATTVRLRSDALTLYEQVLRQKPDWVEMRRQAARLALAVRLESAYKHLNHLRNEFPKDSETAFLLGKYWERKRDPDWAIKAKKEYALAIDCDPANVPAYMRLAELHLEQKEAKEGLAVLDRLVASAGKTNLQAFQPYLARAAHRQSPLYRLSVEKNPEELARAKRESVADIEKAQELAPPGQPDVMLAAASLAMALANDARDSDERQAHVNQAIVLLTAGLSKSPLDARLHSALAVLHIRENRVDEAIRVLEKAQSRIVSQEKSGLMWLLAEAYVDSRQLDKAEQQVAQMAKLKVAKIRLDLLRGKILMAKGQYREAIALLEKSQLQLRGSPLDQQCDLMLGQCYEQLGEFDEQLTIYQRGAKKDMFNVAVRFRLAATLAQSKGMEEEAIKELRTVMSMEGAPVAGYLLLARLHVLKTLSLPFEQRDWRQVDHYLKAMSQVSRLATLDQDRAVEAALLGADVLTTRGYREEAVSSLVETRRAFPKAVGPWLAMASLKARTASGHDIQGAQAVLRDAEETLGDSVELRLARLQLLPPDVQEAQRQLHALATQTERFAPVDRAKLFQGLALAHERLGTVEEAKRWWSAAGDIEPANLGVALALFDLALKKGDQPAMEAALARLGASEGSGGPLSSYARARLLIWRIQNGENQWMSEADSLLKTARARRKHWPRILVAQAVLAQLQKEDRRAADYLQEAVNLGERDPNVIRRLWELLRDGNRQLEAEAVIAKLKEGAELPASLQKLAAEIFVRNASLAPAALAFAQKSVPADSVNPDDHIWLATIRYIANEPKLAEVSFNKALELAPDQPRPYVSLVQFYVRTKKPDKAAAVLQTAQSRLKTGEAATLVALAQCYEALDQIEKAASALQEAVKRKPNDADLHQSVAAFYQRLNQADKAEPHLRKILEPEVKAPADLAAWARRSLAIGMALRGRPEQFREAMDLIQSGAGQGASRVEDYMVRGLLLATKRDRRKEAIASLEKAFQLLKPRGPEPELHLILVELLEAEGDWPRARAEFERLISQSASHGNYWSFVGVYTNKLLNHDALADAKLYVEQLTRNRPNEFGTVAIQVRYLAGLGVNFSEILAVVGGFIDNKLNALTVPADKKDRMLQCARLLETVIPYRQEYREPLASAAERMYRAYVAESDRADAALILALFLGRQKRLADALDICEQAIKKLPMDQVAKAAVKVLTLGEPAERHFRKVEGWFQEALRGKPAGLEMQNYLALLREWEKRFDDAQELYRAVLVKDAGNIVALNNLACLLALEKKEGALELIGRAIDLEGPLGELLDSRSMVYLSLGDFDKARIDLEEALLQEKTAPRYFHLARALKGQGADAEAVRAFDRGLKLGLTADLLHPLEKDAYGEFTRFKEEQKKKKE